MNRKIVATFYSKEEDEPLLLSTVDELENGNRVWIIWKEYGRFTEVCNPEMKEE